MIVLRSKFSLSSQHFLLLVSAVYTFGFNFPFLSHAYQGAFATPNTSLTFVLALPALLFALQYLFFSLLLWPRVHKVFLIIVTLLSLGVLYGLVAFGVVFDKSMLRNVIETDVAEASSYLSWPLFMALGVGGTCVTALIWRTEVVFAPPLSEVSRRLLTSLVLLVLGGGLTWLDYEEFAATGRNNSKLKDELIPFEWVSAFGSVAKTRWFSAPKVYQVIDDHPVLRSFDRPRVTVVIVGETARADHFEYNGYARETNPFTMPYGPVYFADVESCATATAESVPCMFSDWGRREFNVVDARYRENALDIAALAGAEVVWIDNNSSCKGVCDRQPHRRISVDASHPLCDGQYCFDAVLLPEIRSEIESRTAQSKLIVVHEIGSHGPTYYRRYPESMRHFTPDCQRSDIQNCSHEALLNTYDNTIRYSDFVNAEILRLAMEFSVELDINVMYVSDHGESLGESGVYLHGLPYVVAPDEQTHVPLWIWRNQSDDWRECIRLDNSQGPPSHDVVFHTLLDLVGVDSIVRNDKLDVIRDCDVM